MNENLEKQNKYFFQIGIVLALSSVLVAFEWVEYDESDTRVCGLPFEISLEEDGSISEIRLLLGNSKQLNEEALLVLKLLPNWISASHGGRAVRSTMRLPFAFKMAGN